MRKARRVNKHTNKPISMYSLMRLPLCSNKQSYLSPTQTHQPTETRKQTRQRMVTTKTKQSRETTMNTTRIPGIIPKRVQRQSNNSSLRTQRTHRPFLHPERTMNNKKAPLLQTMMLTEAHQSSSQTGGNGDNKPSKNLRTSGKCGPKQTQTKPLRLTVMDDATCVTSLSQRQASNQPTT